MKYFLVLRSVQGCVVRATHFETSSHRPKRLARAAAFHRLRPGAVSTSYSNCYVLWLYSKVVSHSFCLFQVLSGRSDVLSQRILQQVLDRSGLMTAWRAARKLKGQPTPAQPPATVETEEANISSQKGSDRSEDDVDCSDAKLFKIIDDVIVTGMET